jgi:DNA-binding NtrC family response regulator
MPDGMSGIDLAARVHQRRADLPVIFTSGYSAETAGRDLPLKEGVNFLAKPFGPSQLSNIVRKQLDRP